VGSPLVERCFAIAPVAGAPVRADLHPGLEPLRRGAAVVLAALAALSGCHRRDASRAAPAPPKPTLGDVSAEDVTPGGSRPAIDVEGLAQGLRAHLLTTGLFAGSGGDGGAGPVVRVRVAVGAETVEVGAKGEARAQVRVRADSRPAQAPGALGFDLEGQGAKPYAVPAREGPPSLDALALRLASDLVDGFAARRRLAAGPPSAVHAALVADGGELREEAIRAVGERHLSEEAPTLLALLDDPDEPTRDAALGALIALGDRRAVTALTRSRSLHDRHEMRKIIEAISILGGQEAEDYLSFVAATHDDDEIRAAAAAARTRMARRAAEGGGATNPGTAN
jgi:hypothetical protein